MTANPYFWIILTTLAGFYLLDSAANFLNTKSLTSNLPATFKDVYDEVEYRRLLDYTAANSRFEFVESTFNLALLLIFWFCCGYNFLDRPDFSWRALVWKSHA